MPFENPTDWGLEAHDESRFGGQQDWGNTLCPCGSGKKFKHCHGRQPVNNPPESRVQPQLKPIPWDKVPEGLKKKIKEQQDADALFRNEHGAGRPIITAEFQGQRVVAVGNEIHFGPKDNTKFFPDFLGRYLASLLGADWGNAEIAKPPNDRHQIVKWYQSMARYQQSLRPEPDGTYKVEGNGASLSWVRLAYDLYQIKHNAALQARILERLRHKDQFQGARFELCVTAALIAAGFEIEYEDESDNTRKHAEFIARHPNGLICAVEAKSRHRDGVLDYRTRRRQPTQNQDAGDARADVGGILRKALAKDPDLPFLVFVDLNLPSAGKLSESNPLLTELNNLVKDVSKEWPKDAFPANGIFFYNDATYHLPDIVAGKNNVWILGISGEGSKHLLDNRSITGLVSEALWQRANFPNHFPDGE